MNYPIGRTVLVSMVIPPNPTRGLQLKLPMNGVIQNDRTTVIGVEAINNLAMAEGPAGFNAYGANSNVDFTLTLIGVGAVERADKLPLGLIDPTVNGGIIRQFLPFEIDMQASYVELTGPTGQYTAGQVVYLVFYIADKNTGI